jgi:RNA polymerase sigma factor (sigma-70 family)
MNPFLNAHSISDEQLMEKYQAGDYMAFEALYLRHESRVMSYLAKRLRDQESRDEVFQNTFLKLHRKKNQYSSKFAFVKWLYTISRSELLDFCKVKKLETISFEENIYQAHEKEETLLDLDDYSELSEKEKYALKLKYFSNKDYEEISQELNTTQNNSRKLISRGIGKLKLALLGGDK